MKAIDGAKETFYQLSPAEWMMLCSTQNLTFAAVKVLMYLKTLNPWGDRRFEAKTKDLAEALNLNPRTVHRALHELANKNFIDLEITRFKFSLKSHVAVPTPREGLDVAVPTPREGLDVANSRRTDRLKGVQTAQTVCTPRSPSESTDAQGFQEPSYSSYSLDSLKTNNPPISPQGGTGVVANAVQEEEGEQEPIAHEPKLPEQNTTLANNSNPAKDQGSAPRRRSPSKAIDCIKRQYPNKPPDWRMSYEVGDYCIGFKAFVQTNVIDKLPSNSVWATYTPAQLIEENETGGKFANLEERCNQWLYAEAKRQAAEATLAAQTIAAHQESAVQPEVPFVDKPAEIDRIMIVQGLTPAEVLGGMRSHPDYRYSMPKVHPAPEIEWAELANGTLSLVYSYVLKLETDAPTSTP